MRFLPTRIHGAIDYLTGLLLLASPWLFGFADGGAAQWVPVALGAGTILYSLCTAYEFGALRVIPVPAHLLLDGLGGALLAASPWLFGFADRVWMPHLLIGLFEIAASLVTERTPVGLAGARHGGGDDPSRFGDDDMPRHDDPTELEPRPRPASDRGPGATVAQLRRDIDSGATGDKVPVLDPASAPLGTDAEASGVPPSPEVVAAVRKMERAERRSPLDPTDRGEDPHGLRVVGAIALAVALAAVAVWFSFA